MKLIRRKGAPFTLSVAPLSPEQRSEVAPDYDEEMLPQESPQDSPVSSTVDELEARYAELQQKVEDAKKAEA